MDGKLVNDCVAAPFHEDGDNAEGSGLVCGDGGAGRAIDCDDPKLGAATAGSIAGCKHGVCAICLDKIELQETALVKGCEHAYCVTCILRWATYKEKPSCPQCKNPFDFLYVHRSIDGNMHDYMFEESVCLLLRANWFVPLVVRDTVEDFEFDEDLYSHYYGDDDGIDEYLEDTFYAGNFSTLRIGNRRWGHNGYVKAGRKEARPVNRQFCDDSEAGPSISQTSTSKGCAGKGGTGRRAKRAMKREAANAAAAAAARNKQVSPGLEQKGQLPHESKQHV